MASTVATTKSQRSPAYPSMSLREAVQKAVMIYRKEHTYWVDRETAAKDMGYGSVNGASATALATLVKYGLFEQGKGREQVKATPILLSIAEYKAGHPERAAAIREAAFTPSLFAEFRDEFGDRLPSHENLRVQLIRRNFNPRAVDDVIRAYRDTMAFVGEEGASLSTVDEGVDNMEDEAPMEMPRTPAEVPYPKLRGSLYPTPQTRDVSDPSAKLFRFPLSGDCEVEVVYRGNITQEAIDKFKAYLDLSKDAYPATAQDAKVAARVEDRGRMLESGYDDGQEEA